ncbi:MAG: SDR family oxidoreductase [Acidobacteria bacterium]|nr:SDR family oxidoreductase [Acidobacteriota bacterium]
MRNVVISGGGRGIGRAIALAVAEPGAHVVITGRTVEALEATAHELRAHGAEATAVPMDVADHASVARGFRRIADLVTSVHVLVNNAGVGGGEAVQGSDIERWRRTLDVNLFGMYLVTRECLPLMPDESRIVNLSSVLGRFGVPGYTAYCAAKHGVIGYTRALALELAPRRITANALVPGWVDTTMATQGMTQGAAATGLTFDAFRTQALDAVPIKRIIQPEEVARLAKFLAAPESGAITGQTYNICGGQTMD